MDISVVVPSYKPGDYIYDCLDSLFKQSFHVDRFEIILVLNGCNEPYRTIIKDFVDQSHWMGSFVLIQTDTSGVSNARNVGLDAAKGTYIAFIDDDDYVSPSYLERLFSVATRETIAVSNELRLNDSDKTIKEDMYTRYYMQNASKGVQPYRRMRKVFSGPVMKLIHRDIISGFRFDTRFSNGEDSLFLFTISCNISYVAFTTPDAVYYRRVRSGSLVSKEKNIGFVIRNRWNLIKEFLRIYCRRPSAYSLYFLLTRVLGCIHTILISIRSLLRK